METMQPFSYLFGSEIIKEDLSELKESDEFVNSHTQGSQEKAKNFHILRKFPNAEKVLTAHFQKFMDDNFGYPGLKWQITTSWLVKIEKGQSVHYHKHQNSIWSGVFYFGEYTKNTIPLAFRNPIKEAEPFQLGAHMDNRMGSDAAVTPEHNLLICFPSRINHYSRPSEEDKPRYSLAFNLCPTGFYGIGDSTYNTEWMR